MGTRQQKLIDEILEAKADQTDHSLRKKALDRALDASVPNTLTAWEWEQWYEEHGVPQWHEHASGDTPPPWWKRLLRRAFPARN